MKHFYRKELVLDRKELVHEKFETHIRSKYYEKEE